ncbi:MAG: HD domain-containing protein [Promethearchaeota archaeon]
MNNFLTANEILEKAKESKGDFTFKAKLQVVEQIEALDRNGNPYLKIVLKDKTSELRNVKKWISSDKELKDQKIKLDIGNILEIHGEYDRRYGPKITETRVLKPDEYNINNFIETPASNKDELVTFFFDTISAITDERLRSLLELLFSDVEIRKKFIECPSSVINHHAYKYGNLEHTVGMLKIFEKLESYYNRNTNLNVDLIYTGIILHDIGKIVEYKIYNNVPRYIEGSNFLGHMVLGVQLVSRYMKKIENFPKDLKNRIRHLILSHHGKKEWDSIVKPQFAEAEILHFLDMIDSRFKLNFP